MKNVLITGGSRGIGRACAEAFIGAGWRVTVVARTGTDLDAMAASVRPGQLVTIVADLATAAGRARLPEAGFDAVILNAATFRPGPLLTGEDTFAELWQTNVLANHLVARTQVRGMLKRGAGGHLVAIGSLGTDYWPEHLTAYIASKHALRGLFRGWQVELAGTPVKTSLIAPGATLTSSWDGETPPPNILPAATVAGVVLATILNGYEGRITVTPEELLDE